VGRLLQHVLHLDQLSLDVLHVLDERASGVVGAEDVVIYELLGEVLSEEGGEGGGREVLGGEGSEDVLDQSACLVAFSKIRERRSLRPVAGGSPNGK